MTDLLEKLGNSFVDAAPRLLLLLVRMMRVPPEEARDALHAAFVSLAEQVGRGGKTPNLSSREDFCRYLLTSARNRLIDLHRDRKRHEQAELTILQALHASPEEILIRKEETAATEADLARLRTAIKTLKPPYRQIFHKLIYEQKQLVEIAEELGIKKGSIYTQYRRGLGHLAKTLGIRGREP